MKRPGAERTTGKGAGSNQCRRWPGGYWTCPRSSLSRNVHAARRASPRVERGTETVRRGTEQGDCVIDCNGQRQAGATRLPGGTCARSGRAPWIVPGRHLRTMRASWDRPRSRLRQHHLPMRRVLVPHPGIAGRSRLLQHHVLMRRVPVGGGSVPRSLEPLPVRLDFR